MRRQVVGEITPPHLYELQRRLAQELWSEDIRLCENLDGYLSRTDGINAMLRMPNVIMVGFLGRKRHFQEEETTSNIKDLAGTNAVDEVPQFRL